MLKLEIYHDNRSIPMERLNEIASMDEEGVSYYLADSFTHSIGIVSDAFSNEILGVGIIKPIDEFKMIIKPKLSNFTKAKVIKTLVDNGIKNKKTDEVLAIVTKGGQHYIDILEKHFKFENLHGESLRLEF